MENSSLKWGFLSAVFLWWFPIVGPSIVGGIIGFLGRRTDLVFRNAMVTSISMSLFTYFALSHILRIPLLGNSLQFGVALFDGIGAALCVIISSLISIKAVFHEQENDEHKFEFHSKSVEEAERRIESTFSVKACGDPVYTFSQDRVRVTRSCPGGYLSYEVIKELWGFRVFVRLRV